MIVCCYYCMRYPLEYSLLLRRRKDGKEDRKSKANRIASFWKQRMIGSELPCLLQAAKMKHYDLLKRRISGCLSPIQFEKDQEVQVWWLGGFWEGKELQAGWYDATVLSANGDGSYTVKYDDNKGTEVITHRTRVLTSYISRIPVRTHSHTHIYQPLVLSQEIIHAVERIKLKVYPASVGEWVFV